MRNCNFQIATRTTKDTDIDKTSVSFAGFWGICNPGNRLQSADQVRGNRCRCQMRSTCIRNTRTIREFAQLATQPPPIEHAHRWQLSLNVPCPAITHAQTLHFSSEVPPPPTAHAQAPPPVISSNSSMFMLESPGASKSASHSSISNSCANSISACLSIHALRQRAVCGHLFQKSLHAFGHGFLSLPTLRLPIRTEPASRFLTGMAGLQIACVRPMSRF